MGDANLDNETLLYSDKGNGKVKTGGYNDNIVDFYYDSNSKTITFIAMDDDWSVFSIREGENKPTLIGETREVLQDEVSLDKTRYIVNEHNGRFAINKKGSIYIVENGKEKLIKRFYGIYDSKFTGYGTIGFSPDGKYLIYSSSEHMTPLGFIVNNMATGFSGNVYIMDLETGKSSRFIESYNIQWIID